MHLLSGSFVRSKEKGEVGVCRPADASGRAGISGQLLLSMNFGLAVCIICRKPSDGPWSSPGFHETEFWRGGRPPILMLARSAHFIRNRQSH